MENRLVDIEIKIARQEDLLETLNQLVYQQQKKLGELEALCGALARRIKDAAMSDSSQNPVNERPPHY